MKHVWTALAALALLGLVPSAALACGGFFCNNQTMDQAGEEILFGVDPDSGTVQATIRIFYSGDAEDFAWVLPVPSAPELGVSSDEVFQVLRNFTRPSFNLNWADPVGGDCGFYFGFDRADGDFGAGAPNAAEDDRAGGVQVLDSGQVGNFEFETVKSDDGGALFDWLNDNGYVQPPQAEALINHYVDQDMVFVALKLQQNAGAGDITPVTLTFSEQAPCVPLVLTSIAAAPDMPVRLYVASTARAVPTNWFGIEVNQKKIDWLNGGSNYEDLVSSAVDVVSEHGFVTEYAGSNDVLENALYQEGQFDLSSLYSIDDPAQWVMALQSVFGSGSAAILNVLRTHVAMPEAAVEAGVWESDFYNCPDCYPEYYAEMDFDAQAATDALDDSIIKPRREAQQLIDRYPYFTRLYTKISPDNMNRDPLFAFNTGLPDVAKDHTALATPICDGSELIDIQITLPDGTNEFTPELPEWWGIPEGFTADDLSAESDAGVISLLPEAGAEYIVIDRDQIGYIDSQMNMKTTGQIIAELTGTDVIEPKPENPAVPGVTDPGTETPGTSSDGRDSGGCSNSGQGATGFGLLVAAAALFIVARRRFA